MLGSQIHDLGKDDIFELLYIDHFYMYNTIVG